jgi:hypothetical protein
MGGITSRTAFPVWRVETRKTAYSQVMLLLWEVEPPGRHSQSGEWEREQENYYLSL